MDKDFFLIQRMKKGDEEAMELFVRKYYPMILRYCQFHLANQSCAEDMTQETFEKFFRKLAVYQHQGKTANYLYVIAGNLCRDSYKKQMEYPMEELPGQEICRLDGIERQIDLDMALRRLPDEIREVVILHYFQGLKLKEIAGILGIGLPLVKYRVKRAKELLENFLGKGETE